MNSTVDGDAAALDQEDAPYVNFAARAEARRRELGARAENLWPVVIQVEDAFVRDSSLTSAQLCSESGVSTQDWFQLQERARPLSSDHYASWTIEKAESAIAKLSRWLEEIAPRNTDQLWSVAPTPTTEAIFNLIASARERKSLSVIVGGYGVGKTVAAEAAVAEYTRRRDHPGVIRVEVSASCRNAGQLLEHLLFRLQIREPYKLSGQARLMAEVCAELRRGDVVILDECQRLARCGNGAGVEIIRELFDSTPASFVLLGNELINQKGNLLDERLYGAFRSRADVSAGRFMHLSAGDVDEYMAWRGVSGVKLRAELVRLFAAQEQRGRPVLPKRIGGLRALSRVFDTVARLHGSLSEDAILAELDAGTLG